MKPKAGGEPSLEPKMFASVQEIDIGADKLRRRVEEVKGLVGVHYEDERVSNAERRIRQTILEVFGHNSPEYNEHKGYEIWQGGFGYSDGEAEIQSKFAAGIPKAVTMLEGLIDWLAEKKEEFRSNVGYRSKAAFEDLDLHPRIVSVSADLYKNGHYSNAVFDASKALINFVKEKARIDDLDGAPLMRKVFSRANPVLAFNALENTSDQDEQEGMMHLFEGAVLALRNPRGHSFLDDSAERSLEYIALLSMLANRLEEARYISRST